MEMKFLVNERKLIVALICCIIFAGITVLLVSWKLLIFALISFVLCIVYCIVALHNGRTVQINPEGASFQFFSKKTFISWDNIQEVGVVGLKVLNSNGKNHKGSKNIYLSDKKMSVEELFDMCLNWPPKDIPYFRFTYKRIAFIQKIWTQDVNLYNVGDLHF